MEWIIPCTSCTCTLLVLLCHVSCNPQHTSHVIKVEVCLSDFMLTTQATLVFGGIPCWPNEVDRITELNVDDWGEMEWGLAFFEILLIIYGITPASVWGHCNVSSKEIVHYLSWLN